MRSHSASDGPPDHLGLLCATRSAKFYTSAFVGEMLPNILENEPFSALLNPEDVEKLQNALRWAVAYSCNPC